MSRYLSLDHSAGRLQGADAAKAVWAWLAAVGAETATIEPGSPWENGYHESFNSKLRDG